jgi:acetyltransferase
MVLHPNLLDPKSIVVVGGSDHLDHLGGSVLKNLLDQEYLGKLMAINPKRSEVQGIRCYPNAEEFPGADLAIIAIPAEISYDTIRILSEKGTRAFLLFSAGFSECGKEGRKLEKKIHALLEKNGSVLLGPNNIGLINRNYAGIFTRPIPKLDPDGVDFVSGSGATAVFTIEAAMQMGLRFNSLYTVGNSMQIGIEEILEYWDQTHGTGQHSLIKMIYMEGIRNPSKFLRHCISLRKKGCRILALKAGVTDAGVKAASSHTGAMATDDLYVQALFDHAGIIRCNSRYGLVATASVLHGSKGRPSRFAIVTHAGGPGVITTDSLTKHGLQVPTLSLEESEHLASMLYPGAACSNPIDILATGTAEQLGKVIDYCDREVDEIDGIIVIFGSPGLRSVEDAITCIEQKIKHCIKPVFPVLPSVINVKDEIAGFIKNGNVAFFDESLLAQGLRKVNEAGDPREMPELSDKSSQSSNLPRGSQPGYMDSITTFQLIRDAGIQVVESLCFDSKAELAEAKKKIQFPVAAKSEGLVHKSDQGGVELNINDMEGLHLAFDRLTAIPDATGIMVQQMLQGQEIFIGSKRIEGFPPLVFCGFGGIYLEVVRDLAYGFAPMAKDQAKDMLERLKMYKVLSGMRGQKGVDLDKLADAIVKLSLFVYRNPRIVELDINPLMASEKDLIAVDARILLGK